VNFDLKKPCSTCPFRHDVQPFLTLPRAKEILGEIIDEDKTFSCHKHNSFDDDGDVRETKNSQHCAGALILLERANRPNQLMRIAERIGYYDRRKIDMTAPVYSSKTAMLAAYRKARV
jgi:hypothetical protein